MSDSDSQAPGARLFRFVEARNRQEGRRTDYLEWLKIFANSEGRAIYVGAHMQVPGLRIKSTLDGALVMSRNAGLDAGPIQFVGPVLVTGTTAEVIYQRPLAYAIASSQDPEGSLVWIARLTGRIEMEPPTLFDVHAKVCNPSDFAEQLDGRFHSLPLKVCEGDRVTGMSERVRELVDDRTFGIEVSGGPLSLQGGLCPYYLAKEWEPRWIDDFIEELGSDSESE